MTNSRPGSLGRSFRWWMARGVDLPWGKKMRRSEACGNWEPHVRVPRSLDDEGHATHAHTIVTASHDPIVRKAASVGRWITTHPISVMGRRVPIGRAESVTCPHPGQGSAG